ncbi:hypothetical protein Afer_0795 [Acidimicrobium ferrooxidans DSM 10331]|uniref:Uncharacterized protein n=1 Tax=Acidimicrobium ferrooxidans (strain DSM 10331 / JCM 15462 / NBRC 103882 / ICP) TaxID=525909 RepID=C7LYD5_ACIFD|nr:hypothetical protein Afer_0795 [Acidimicrobium ferrooxidans DSM 10331]
MARLTRSHLQREPRASARATEVIRFASVRAHRARSILGILGALAVGAALGACGSTSPAAPEQPNPAAFSSVDWQRLNLPLPVPNPPFMHVDERLSRQRPVYLVEGGQTVAVLAYEATNFASITPASILLFRATRDHQASLVEALYTAYPALLPHHVTAVVTPTLLAPHPDQPLALPPVPVSAAWIAHNGSRLTLCLMGSYGPAPSNAAEHVAYYVVSLRWRGSGFALVHQSIEAVTLLQHHHGPPTIAPPAGCSHASA